MPFSRTVSDREGIDEWFPLISGRRYEPISITVPITAEWSPMISIPRVTKKTTFLYKRPILAEMDGRVVTLDPQKSRNWGSVKKIRFKLLDGDSDQILTIPFEFWPVP